MKHIFFIALSLFFLKIDAQNRAIILKQNQRNYIETPDVASLFPVNNFTIEYVITVRVQPGYNMAILNKAECVTNQASYTSMFSTDNKVTFSFNCVGHCSNTIIYICNTPLNLGQCYHIAYTYSSLGPKIYIDGVLQPGTFLSGSGYCGDLYDTPEPFRMGAYRYIADTLGGFLEGMLDELRVWNYVRSGSQIASQLYNELTGTEMGLLLYYKFNDNISGNGEIVTNSASFTGTQLDGVTLSQNSLSPYTDYSCFAYTDVEKLEKKNTHISIFPNPSTGIVTINSDLIPGKNTVVNIEITDLSGRTVMRINEINLPANINIEKLVKGVYFIKLYGSSETYTSKIVRE